MPQGAGLEPVGRRGVVYVMNRRSDKIRSTIAILAVCLFMALTSGCIEEQQAKPVWGKGDLPPAWLETFGNGNDSRMNFMQSQAITAIAKRLRVLEINQYVPDPNEVGR